MIKHSIKINFIIFVIFFSTSLCQASGDLYVRNDSSWNVLVTTQAAAVVPGAEQYRAEVVKTEKRLSPGDQVNVGVIRSIGKVTYKSYGRVFGVMARSHLIEITDIMKKSNNDYVAVIGTDALGAWKVDMNMYKPEQESIMLPRAAIVDRNYVLRHVFPQMFEAENAGMPKERVYRILFKLPESPSRRSIDGARDSLMSTVMDTIKDKDVLAVALSIIREASGYLLEHYGYIQ